MINKPGLLRILDDLERGVMPFPEEIKILREAVDLLDDLAGTLDKVMNGYGTEAILRGYDRETTQQLKIIEQGKIRGCDDHRGNRP